MIAYNKKWLYDIFVRGQADRALNNNYISKEEHEKIGTAFRSFFYTPNIFVRIGLFILTVVIALFTFGLFLLLFLSGNEARIGILFIVFGILTYAGLEIMVAKKRHYKSGVDDALLWITPVSIVIGANLIANVSWLEDAIIVFILASFLFARFINWIMAGVAGVSLVAIIFLVYIKLGETAKASVPFIIMIVSILIYIGAARLINKERYKLYSHGSTMVSVIGLIGFYVSCNYFVIRETSIALFELNLQEGQSIPFGWLFWILTIVTPIAYIARGIQRKDTVLLRVGLILIAAIVFTVRYYYHVIPVEKAAVIGGIIMIALAYFLIRYLREPKHGFTYKKDNDPDSIGKFQIESLVIAETFTGAQPSSGDNFHFGGGSGGGAGASGTY
jgi:hypothetical protein